MKHGMRDMRQEETSFHQQLKKKIDEYVRYTYRITRQFPREELYGIISQLRRAALSVMLNYIEGYARGRNKVHKNFLEIAYGSLKESEYLYELSAHENFITKEECEKATILADEIGAMLWGTFQKL